MPKVPKKVRDPALSGLALQLLRSMAREPALIRYNTEVLGGMFRNDAVTMLDLAYEELGKQGLIEPAGAVIFFFGAPKSLTRITRSGESFIAEWDRAHGADKGKGAA